MPAKTNKQSFQDFRFQEEKIFLQAKFLNIFEIFLKKALIILEERIETKTIVRE